MDGNIKYVYNINYRLKLEISAPGWMYRWIKMRCWKYILLTFLYSNTNLFSKKKKENRPEEKTNIFKIMVWCFWPILYVNSLLKIFTGTQGTKWQSVKTLVLVLRPNMSTLKARLQSKSTATILLSLFMRYFHEVFWSKFISSDLNLKITLGHWHMQKLLE